MPMMSPTDVDENVVLRTIEEMPSSFRTKQLSQHRLMLERHQTSADDPSARYNQAVGTFLSDLARKPNSPIRQASRGVSNAWWEKTTTDASSVAGSSVGGRPDAAVSQCARTVREPASHPVRPGHYRTLEYMATAKFREVKALFESYPEIGGVYFRPTDRGVTVLDLHPDSPKPRIGVGDDPYIECGTSAEELAPTMEARIAHLQKVRARQRTPSRENQFEARLIREAQGDHLRLPGFPDCLRFIHSQWRMDPAHGGTAQLTDLIAVDLASGSLVLIELKAKPDPSAIQQVESYLDYFRRNGEALSRFFARVAQVMGALYDCPELTSLDSLEDPAVTLVGWPGASGLPEVQGLEQLEPLT